jgi:LPXTG-motif cell wall-anchored protein
MSVVRHLPLVPVSHMRTYYAGPRLNCGSPAVAYGGWVQNLLHPKRAQASQQEQVQAQDNDIALAQASIDQAKADSEARFMWAAAAGVAALVLGGGALYWKKRKGARKNGRRRNR